MSVHPFKAAKGIFNQIWKLENVATLIKIHFRTGQSSSDVCRLIDNPRDDWRSRGHTNGAGKAVRHEEMPDALDAETKAQYGCWPLAAQSCFVLRAISEVFP